MLTRRQFLWGGIGGLAGCGGYTALIEPFWLEVVERPLALRNASSGLRGLRLVQVSDIHGFLLQVRFNVRPEVTVFTLS